MARTNTGEVVLNAEEPRRAPDFVQAEGETSLLIPADDSKEARRPTLPGLPLSPCAWRTARVLVLLTSRRRSGKRAPVTGSRGCFLAYLPTRQQAPAAPECSFRCHAENGTRIPCRLSLPPLRSPAASANGTLSAKPPCSTSCSPCAVRGGASRKGNARPLSNGMLHIAAPTAA